MEEKILNLVSWESPKKQKQLKLISVNKYKKQITFTNDNNNLTGNISINGIHLYLNRFSKEDKKKIIKQLKLKNV